MVIQFEYWSLFTFPSECTQYSDCPNGGQNYKCIDDLCSCEPGYALDGDSCVGMCPVQYMCIFYYCRGYIFTTFSYNGIL